MLLSIPEIHTDLLWDLSILFGSLCFLYFGFIFFFRNRLTSKSRNISERRKELAPVISNFLFYGDKATKEEKYEYVGLKVGIREFLKDPVNRGILKEILLDLQRDLTGDARMRLFSLYKDFDLHLDALGKLKSWRWEMLAMGVVELTQMQVTEAYSPIRRFINHRRSVIRKHAQIATVSLKHEGIAHFLDSNKYPISEWQQIKILEILRNKEDFIPPNFALWLMSGNKDVVLFSLRLIRHYNQTGAKASVTELLKHKDDEIKQAAIDCIKEFGITEAIPTLMAAFSRAKRDTRILILDAIGSMGTEEHIGFLKEVQQKESDFNVRSKALAAINMISPESVLPHENLDPHIEVVAGPQELRETERTVQPLIDSPSTSGETSEAAETEIEVSEETIALFHEDLEVFDCCFMEELNEILDSRQNDEPEEEVKYLPLDFLPIVKEKLTDMNKKKPKMKSKKKLRKIRVFYEEVHPDAEFREELENILSRVEVQNPDGNTEVEYLNFNFLPFVIEDASAKKGIPALLEEINEMEVDGVEIVLPEEMEMVESSEPEREDTTEHLPDAYDACALVDWDEVRKDTDSEFPGNNDGNPIKNEDPAAEPYLAGHSIFEELFRKCDEDSKLILLNEMIELGDHKEVAFLMTLKKDPSIRIRNKVNSVIAQLSKRLEMEARVEKKDKPLIKWEVKPAQDGMLNFEVEEIPNKIS